MLLLLVIEVTGFLQEKAFEWSPSPSRGPYGLQSDWESQKPLSRFGLTPETANAIRANNWWLHAVLALAFTAAIPWYKAKHMLTVLVSLSVRDGKALKRLPPDTEDRDHSGYRDMADFTWKNMLHLDACTKCGRCHEACPAANSHFPLSPRLPPTPNCASITSRSAEGPGLGRWSETFPNRKRSGPASPAGRVRRSARSASSTRP